MNKSIDTPTPGAGSTRLPPVLQDRRATGQGEGLLTRFRRRREITAIDLDRRMFRVAHLVTSKGRHSIRRLEIAHLPAGLDPEDPIALGQWIGLKLRELRIDPGSVVMAVPRSQATLQEIMLPPIKDKGEMASVVRLRAARDLPFPESEAVVDFTVQTPLLPANKSKNGNGGQSRGLSPEQTLRVVVVAVQKSTVVHYNAIAGAAGLTLAGLGLRPLATFRTFKALGSETGSKVTFLVSLRRHEVDVDVSIEGRLVFSRELSVDLDPADGDDPPSRQAKATSASREVTRCLHSFEGSPFYERPDKIIIVGGTGLEAEVMGLIEGELKIKCQHFTPEKGIRLPRDRESLAPRVLTPLGLALGMADSAGLPINFLAPKRPVVRRNEGRTIWLLVIALLMAAFFLLFVVRAQKASIEKAETTRIYKELQVLLREEKKSRQEFYPLGSTDRTTSTATQLQITRAFHEWRDAKNANEKAEKAALYADIVWRLSPGRKKATNAVGNIYYFKQIAVQGSSKKVNFIKTGGSNVVYTVSGKGDQSKTFGEFLAEGNIPSSQLKLPSWERVRKNHTKVSEWTGARQDWLGHMAFLSSILPQCDEVYLSRISTSAGGRMRFTLQARKSETLHAFDQKLRELGYKVNPISLTPGKDPHGYPFRTTFELITPAKFPQNLNQYLKTNTPPARLPDDIHAEGLSQAGQKTKGQSHG